MNLYKKSNDCRLSSDKLEDIQWRYRQSLANARIEGININNKYEDFFQKLRKKGVSEREIRQKFIDMIKQR